MLLKDTTEVAGDTVALAVEDKAIELLVSKLTESEALVFSTQGEGGACVVPGRLAGQDGECVGRHDLWKYLWQKEHGVGTDF